MNTTIDSAGRLVIPKEIRREAKLAPVRLQRRGRLLVAVPRRKTPELTPEAVEETRTRLLDQRAQRG